MSYAAHAILARPVTLPGFDFLKLADEFDRDARLVERVAGRMGAHYGPAVGSIYDHRIRELRAIAADCRAAADGCEASEASVLGYLAEGE